MDTDIYDEPDASRPFFQRKKREIGVYMSVYDADPVEEKSFGLEHFFLMRTNDMLFQEFNKMDLVNIRAAFDMKGLMTDSYLERFEPGIVMAIAFDTVEALESIWRCYQQGRLAPVLHNILITPGVMKAVSTARIQLEVRLWDDEYHACKSEIQSDGTDKFENIRTKVKDMSMVKRLKAYQVNLGSEVLRMRDLEFQMEEKRADFFNCIKRLIPENKETIVSLREFESLTKEDNESKLYNKAPLDMYKRIVAHWRDCFTAYQTEVVTPLLQIHKSCEIEEQRATKAKIIDQIKYMQTILKKDHSLQEVVHPEAAKKVLRREAGLFLGLMSLVPLGVERVADMDILIDEYMRKFKLDENE